MDILNKMTVPELKSILREHKKVHYQPYSKLDREKLIKLITHYRLHETTDISKHIKVKVKKVRVKKVRVKKEGISAKIISEPLNDDVNFDLIDVGLPVKRKPRRKKA